MAEILKNKYYIHHKNYYELYCHLPEIRIHFTHYNMSILYTSMDWMISLLY